MLETISKSKIFLYCLVSFVFGITIASFVPKELIKNDLLFFIGVILLLIIVLLFWKNKKVRIIGLIAFFLFLGIWRYSISLPVDSPDNIWFYNGETVVAYGIIANDPDVRATSQKLEIKVKKINEYNYKINGKILVTTNIFPMYKYGDAVVVTCELKEPERFKGFSYDKYLARFDIYSVCYWPFINKLSIDDANKLILSNSKWNFKELLYKKIFSLKNRLREYIDFGLGEPEASLANAMILGDKKGIPSDLREKFSQAGLSHIIAISGMHISIIVILVVNGFLMAGLTRKKVFYTVVLFLFVYIFLIGLPASAARAGLMGFLVLLAMQLGRLNKIINSLALVAVILLIINPKLLRDDIGFQLSFLAILGIVYFVPIFDKWYDNLLKILKHLNLKFQKKIILFFVEKIGKIIFGILGVTIAAQIFILPIIAINFSQISIIAPISNLLILWTLPVLIVAILAGLVFSAIIPNFGVLWFLLANIILKYIIFIVEVIIKLPFSFIEIHYIWWGWVSIYYFIVVLFIVKLGRSR